MGEVRCTAEQVIRAIEGSGGVKVVIARKLNVHRDTVENYLNRYPTVRQAYDQEVSSVGDDAENVIIDAIRGHDPDRALDTAKWYARMKLKDRGYAEKQETEQTGAVTVKVEYVNSPEPDAS